MVDLSLYNNAASLIDAGSADYRQRLAALQAQQNAASAAAQAAAQQGGTNRAKQYADSVAGGMNDLRNTGGAGMFGGALQTQQQLNAAGIADQGARTAQHLAEAGAVINTSFNDRLAGATTLQAQSKDTLAHDFYDLASQQADATSSGGGGGGGGSGGGGGGGGSSSGDDTLTAGEISGMADHAWRQQHQGHWKDELFDTIDNSKLEKSVRGSFRGHGSKIEGIFPNGDEHFHPGGTTAWDHMGKSREKSLAEWDAAHAKKVAGKGKGAGFSKTALKKFWDRAALARAARSKDMRYDQEDTNARHLRGHYG